MDHATIFHRCDKYFINIWLSWRRCPHYYFTDSHHDPNIYEDLKVCFFTQQSWRLYTRYYNVCHLGNTNVENYLDSRLYYLQPLMRQRCNHVYLLTYYHVPNVCLVILINIHLCYWSPISWQPYYLHYLLMYYDVSNILVVQNPVILRFHLMLITWQPYYPHYLLHYYHATNVDLIILINLI